MKFVMSGKVTAQLGNPMINNQPVESVSKDDKSVEIVDIFWTIQGEGPFSGMPALFVRLAGCDLMCPLCDTDYTTNRQRFDVEDLACKIMSHVVSEGSAPINLIVFTGGEPFRQAGLGSLIRIFTGSGIHRQIETNGTLHFPTDDETVIVCSPKNGYLAPTLCDAFLHSDKHCFKYVLDSNHICKEDGLPTSVLGKTIRPARPPWRFPKSRIYLQPADEKDEEKNKSNQDAVLDSCMRFGYRLCLQVHKLVGLP